MTWFGVAVVCLLVGALVVANALIKSASGIVEKILGFAGVGESGKKWSESIVGVLAICGAVAWWHWPAADKEPAAGLMMAGDTARVDDAGAEKIPDAMTCPCGSPAVCVGPKGGRYCVTIDGKKRYK